VRFLADENLEGAIVTWLRSEGHNVYWAAEEAPAATDVQLLSLARSEERVLVTNDVDFGELVFRRGLATTGILLLRYEQQTEASRLKSLSRQWGAISAQLSGRFTVATEWRIRIRPLLPPSSREPEQH